VARPSGLRPLVRAAGPDAEIDIPTVADVVENQAEAMAGIVKEQRNG
jgi:hypothetical protein